MVSTTPDVGVVWLGGQFVCQVLPGPSNFGLAAMVVDDAMDVDIEFDIEVKLAQAARGAHVSALRHVLDTSCTRARAFFTRRLWRLCTEQEATNIAPRKKVSYERAIVCKVPDHSCWYICEFASLQHWLRGLCKKGPDCDFLHELNLKKMPECWFFNQYGGCCAFG